MGEGIVLLNESEQVSFVAATFRRFNQITGHQKLELMLKDLAAPMEGLSAQLANMQAKQDEGIEFAFLLDV